MPTIDLSGAVIQSNSPVIDSKNYSTARDAIAEYEIAVSGSAAGDAPNVILFRRFEGAFGDDVNLSPNASVGEIGTLLKTSTSKNPYIIDDDGFACVANRDETNQVGSFYFTFTPTHEFRLATSEKVPNDKAFPGNGSRETIPTGSNCKSIWIMNGSNGSGVAAQADLCVPTYVGVNVQIQGNASQPYGAAALYTFDHGFDFFGWNHTDHYQKADPTNPTTANGTIETMFSSARINGASKTTGGIIASATAPVHGASTTVQAANSQFDYLRFWSYCLVRRTGETEVQLSQFAMKNVYFATGANSYQCLYLMNASTFAAATFKTPVVATEWDNVGGIIRFIPSAWELNYCTHYGLHKADGSWQTGLISELTTV